ncbi:hypothetical protein [Sphingomonas abaci]|uniref:CDP-diacylglycerol pyrophosphatase n=1 Tax=Sphingomonas abaci TaxID=237611 RepID=A0A7W7EY16_9SPHN|nr:hypothetical protein [Sphingomonas abaci]MBB4617686.1 CDP-diacylglycerol pyrophosphatase [Sphingomonas abaci]
MSVPVSVARRRWLLLQAVRIAGVAGAILGVMLVARAPDILSKVIGIALTLSAIVVTAIVPAGLAHRWRSDRS